MSIHGICFDNGQSGNCGMDCEQFTDGDCPAPEEFIPWLKEMGEDNCQFQIKDYDLLSQYPGVFDYLYVESIDDRVKRISETWKGTSLTLKLQATKPEAESIHDRVNRITKSIKKGGE